LFMGGRHGALDGSGGTGEARLRPARGGSCRQFRQERPPRRIGALERGGGRSASRHQCPGPGAPREQPRYEVAPTARATCHHVGSQGKLRGKCSTIRRTERSTHTASLSKRSRSVVTWASAQAVPTARRRSSWNRMYAASVSRTRSWLARNRQQLVRSSSKP